MKSLKLSCVVFLVIENVLFFLNFVHFLCFYRNYCRQFKAGLFALFLLKHSNCKFEKKFIFDIFFMQKDKSNKRV